MAGGESRVEKNKVNNKQQWDNPAETLDKVIGILTGLPITETFGMDAIGVAIDAMSEIMELRRKLNEANRAIRDLTEGKHGTISHPAQIYKSGIWLIKSIDNYQDSSEWLMSEADFRRISEDEV